MILVSFIKVFIQMTAPIIQQQQQPSSTVNSQNINSAESWNNYEWANQFNSADYQETADNDEDDDTDEDEDNNTDDEDDDDEDDDDSSSYTSDNLPELENQSSLTFNFENPANSSDWRDRHISRNFSSYNEFHEYITTYHLEYNEYFGIR